MKRIRFEFGLAALAASLMLPKLAQAQNSETQVLPRSMTEAESRDEPAGLVGYLPWDPHCADVDPRFAAALLTDGPPSTSRFPTESEQTRGAMYGWPSYGPQMSPLTELIRNSVQQAGYETNVMVPASLRASAETTL